MDSAGRAYAEKLAQVTEYLRSRQVPRHLRQRVSGACFDFSPFLETAMCGRCGRCGRWAVAPWLN